MERRCGPIHLFQWEEVLSSCFLLHLRHRRRQIGRLGFREFLHHQRYRNHTFHSNAHQNQNRKDCLELLNSYVTILGHLQGLNCHQSLA